MEISSDLTTPMKKHQKKTRKPYKKRVDPLKALISQCSVNCQPSISSQTVGELVSSMLATADVETIQVDVAFPIDWWQAVKERFFPQWAKARWPVQLQKHTYYSHRFKEKDPLAKTDQS